MKSQREIFSENLQKLIDKNKIDQKELAVTLNVSDTTISNWVRGLKYPRIDKIQAIADFFGVKMSDLITDKSTSLIHVTRKTVKIPILGTIACGIPIYAVENFEGYIEEIADFVPSGNVYYLKAKGNSMEPTIPNGSHVMIREQPTVEEGEIAAVLVNGDTEATLKRVKKQGDIILLVPDNPSYSPYVITKNNPAKIIGKAVKYVQSL